MRLDGGLWGGGGEGEEHRYNFKPIRPLMHYYMYRMHEYVDVVHSLLLCIEKIGPYRNIQLMYIFNAFCIILYIFLYVLKKFGCTYNVYNV
jgi:hypothetical protein